MKDRQEPQAIVDEIRSKVLEGGAPDNFTAVCVRVSGQLPEPEAIDDCEKEESDLLLKVAEERKDYGAN